MLSKYIFLYLFLVVDVVLHSFCLSFFFFFFLLAFYYYTYKLRINIYANSVFVTHHVNQMSRI